MYTPFDLHGSVALVTGGNSGIGLGMATALGAAGAAVAIWGRSPDRNAAAADALTSTGVDASAVEVDVSDADAVTAAFAVTLARHGRVDTAVVNAGTGAPRIPFHELPRAEFRRVLATNLDGAVFTLQAAAGHMADRGGPGSIITVSSIGAVNGMPGKESYAASKGALISLTKAVAVEYARYGVRANTILPGFIDTPMNDGMVSDEAANRKLLPRIPVRRWGVGDDFGGLAVYLASSASAYQTGTTTIVDGGYSIF